MNKTIKKLLCAGLTVAMVFQIAGCEKAKTGQDQNKITLRLWTKMTQDADAASIEYHDAWMSDLQAKFPDVIFEEAITPAGTDYRQEYDKALMAGTAPAFMARFSYTDIPTRMKNGTIADITRYVENWDLKEEGKIMTTFDEAISSDGKWYALPYKAYTQACLVNKKLLRENGEDAEKLPETWQEFAEQGQRITDFSIPRVGYALVGMDWCAWPFTAWVWAAGGEMVRKNDDGTYKIAFNEPEGVDAAVFMNEMIWKYKMTQKDVLMSMSELEKLAQSETAVYSWNQLSVLSDKAIETYSLEPSDFSVMAMPVKDASIERPALAGGEVITFNPKLTDKELEKAVEVAKYMYFSEEQNQIYFDYVRKNGRFDTTVPGRIDLYEKKLEANVRLTESMREELVLQSKTAKPEPYCPHWSDIKTELVIPLQEIFLEENITREEVQKLLDDCAQKLYDLYPDTFTE